jgi:hypothetical protein
MNLQAAEVPPQASGPQKPFVRLSHLPNDKSDRKNALKKPRISYQLRQWQGA